MKKYQKRKCPLCESNNFTSININEPIEKVGHNVLCNKCGLIYHNPVMAYYQMADYYTSAFSDEYHESESMQQELADNRFVLLKKNIDTSRISPVLEIGCAYGDFLKKLNEEGIYAEGIEPNEYLSRIGRDKYGVEITTGTYETLPEKKNRYGMIAMFHVLEHFFNPVEILRKAHGDLRENGFLYLVVPTLEETQLALVFKMIHPTIFVRETLEAMVEKTGFSVEMVIENGYNLSLFARKSTVKNSTYPDASLIFERVKCYLSERNQVLESIVKKLDLLKGKDRVAVYGAGHNTIDLNEVFPLSQLDIEGIYDADPAKQGKTLLGYDIRSPEVLNEFKGAAVIISSYRYQEEIAEQLSYLKDREISLITLYNKNHYCPR